MRRISIAGLMGFILVATIGLAALCRPSYLLAAGLLSLLLAALSLAVVGAIFKRGPARAFWAGFAIVGWIYAITHLAPGLEGTIGRKSLGAALADVAYSQVGPLSRLQRDRAARSSSIYLDPTYTWAAWNGWENGLGHDAPLCPTTYVRIVHSLLGLFVAWVGGLLARRFAAP